MKLQKFRLFYVGWPVLTRHLRSTVPPLTDLDHKGTMGRVGIVGGSKDFTGAPYYAGISSLRFGADLSYIFCAEGAALPIKSYSPELMVTPFYNEQSCETEFQALSEWSNVHGANAFLESKYQQYVSSRVKLVTDFFPRLHSLVVGPGLGRHWSTQSIVSEVLARARSDNLPLVIDADALWLVTQNLALVRGYRRCILTPNKMEFERLLAAVIQWTTSSSAPASDVDSNTVSAHPRSALLDELQSRDELLQLRALSVALGGVTILKKGLNDAISNGRDVWVLEETGSPRRCGGQGDILAGTLGVALHWALNKSNVSLLSLYSPEHPFERFDEKESAIQVEAEESLTCSDTETLERRVEDSSTVLAAMLGSVVTKKTSEAAFRTHKRSMTSPDVIEHLGEVVDSLFPVSV